MYLFTKKLDEGNRGRGKHNISYINEDCNKKSDCDKMNFKKHRQICTPRYGAIQKR